MINSSFKTIAQSIGLVITTVTRCQPVLRMGAFFLFHSKDEFQLLLGFVAVFFYFISFYSQIRFVLLSFLRSITWRNNTWRQPGFSIRLLMIHDTGTLQVSQSVIIIRNCREFPARKCWPISTNFFLPFCCKRTNTDTHTHNIAAQIVNPHFFFLSSLSS